MIFFYWKIQKIQKTKTMTRFGGVRWFGWFCFLLGAICMKYRFVLNTLLSPVTCVINPMAVQQFFPLFIILVFIFIFFNRYFWKRRNPFVSWFPPRCHLPLFYFQSKRKKYAVYTYYIFIKCQDENSLNYFKDENISFLNGENIREGG